MKQGFVSLWQENGTLSMVIQRHIVMKQVKLPIIRTL